MIFTAHKEGFKLAHILVVVIESQMLRSGGKGPFNLHSGVYSSASPKISPCDVQPLVSGLPYRLIKSRWLVGTDDLFTVETIHSSRVSNFWIFFRNFGLGAGYSIG